jgi:hypothetical protein
MDALFATSTTKAVWAQLRGRKIPGVSREELEEIQNEKAQEVEVSQLEKQ